MRGKERIKPFMNELARIWEENCPDWRFGQFIENVFSMINKPTTFYMEDDDMLWQFKKYFNDKGEIKMEDINIIAELQSKYEADKESLDIQQLRTLFEYEKEKYNQVKEIVDEFYNNVDYSLRDMFDDLVEVIGDGKDEN